MELDTSKNQLIHYIPFNKKTVDDIIAKSAKTDKDTIKFCIKFGSDDSPTGPRMESRDYFTYEQFVWDWKKVCEYYYKPTVQAYTEWVNSQKAKDGLSFEPT
jgi:hypothetical protein